MRRLMTCLAACSLVGVGYILGAADFPAPALLLAQGNKPEDGAAADISGPSEETLTKIKAADDALKAAMEALKQEELYFPATKIPNALAITAGGVNAVKDLESGRGVDPETFAALYAGLATDEVAENLERDSDNHLLYKNKVIKMYPITRLKSFYSKRAALAGEKDLTTDEKKPGKKAPNEAPAEDAGDSE